MLTKLYDAYPKIAPTVTIANSYDIIALTANRQLDVGIVEGERHKSASSKIKWKTFAEDEMFMAASPRHPVFTRDATTPPDFKTCTWIVREEGSGTREMQNKAFELLGFQPSRLIVLGSTQAIKETVEAGVGLSLLSRHTLRKELEAGTLQLVPCEGFPLKRHFSLIMPDSQFQTKAVELFAAMVCESGDWV